MGKTVVRVKAKRRGDEPPPHVFGASVAGPGHRATGLRCQDACAYAVGPGPFAVIAVADGLGSVSSSDVGARTAVDAAVEVIVEEASTAARRKDQTRLVREGVFAARAALEVACVERQCDIREVACTLIVAVLRGQELWVAHIGDGAVIAQIRGLTLVSGPGPSEYVNEVAPLTDAAWTKHLRLAHAEAVEAVAVLTDGCQPAALQRREGALHPFPRFFGPVFDYIRPRPPVADGEEEIRHLLSSSKLEESSEDDKTLVVAVP